MKQMSYCGFELLLIKKKTLKHFELAIHKKHPLISTMPRKTEISRDLRSRVVDLHKAEMGTKKSQ